MTAIEPEEIVRELLELDRGLRNERYYGEQAIFYNPGRAIALGVIFASIKDHDGPNDRRANLSLPGIYRLAFGLPRDTFVVLFGETPARPAKGEAVELPSYDLKRLDELMPHPVYAWMSCPDPRADPRPVRVATVPARRVAHAREGEMGPPKGDSLTPQNGRLLEAGEPRSSSGSRKAIAASCRRLRTQRSARSSSP